MPILRTEGKRNSQLNDAESITSLLLGKLPTGNCGGKLAGAKDPECQGQKDTSPWKRATYLQFSITFCGQKVTSKGNVLGLNVYYGGIKVATHSLQIPSQQGTGSFLPQLRCD